MKKILLFSILLFVLRIKSFAQENRAYESIIELVVNTGDNTLFSCIFYFKKNSALVDWTYLNDIVSTVGYLSNHKDAQVIILGYTSPAGNQLYNLYLSEKRTNATKSCLVNFGIAASRIKIAAPGNIYQRKTEIMVYESLEDSSLSQNQNIILRDHTMEHAYAEYKFIDDPLMPFTHLARHPVHGKKKPDDKIKTFTTLSF